LGFKTRHWKHSLKKRLGLVLGKGVSDKKKRTRKNHRQFIRKMRRRGQGGRSKKIGIKSCRQKPARGEGKRDKEEEGPAPLYAITNKKVKRKSGAVRRSMGGKYNRLRNIPYRKMGGGKGPKDGANCQKHEKIKRLGRVRKEGGLKGKRERGGRVLSGFGKLRIPGRREETKRGKRSSGGWSPEGGKRAAR